MTFKILSSFLTARVVSIMDYFVYDKSTSTDVIFALHGYADDFCSMCRVVRYPFS